MQPKNAHALNNTWKRQDTTKDLIVWFSGVMPNPSHAWTVRVADSKGYLGDYDATLQGNRFVIDTGQFADFPVGDYVLEVWETYSKDGKAETGIYPNPDSFVTFKINANVVDDDLIKSFDLDEVLGKAAARANKAIVVDGTETLPAGSQAAVESRYDGERVHYTFKIPQGEQGAPGHVDNLLSGSTTEWKHNFSGWENIPVVAGADYSLSGKVRSSQAADGGIIVPYIRWLDANGNRVSQDSIDGWKYPFAETSFSGTKKAPTGACYANVFIAYNVGTPSYEISSFMFVQWSTPVSYAPAPSDYLYNLLVSKNILGG